jgi:hypothetical protein
VCILVLINSNNFNKTNKIKNKMLNSLSLIISYFPSSYQRDCATKTNMGQKGYQSTAYDLPFFR